jgi:hypothetical protein
VAAWAHGEYKERISAFERADIFTLVSLLSAVALSAKRDANAVPTAASASRIAVKKDVPEWRRKRLNWEA